MFDNIIVISQSDSTVCLSKSSLQTISLHDSALTHDDDDDDDDD